MGRLTLPRLSPELRRRLARPELRVDVGYVTGLAAIALGCGWIYKPLSLIVGGALLAWISWRSAGVPPAQPTRVLERIVIGPDEDED